MDLLRESVVFLQSGLSLKDENIKAFLETKQLSHSLFQKSMSNTIHEEENLVVLDEDNNVPFKPLSLTPLSNENSSLKERHTKHDLVWWLAK